MLKDRSIATLLAIVLLAVCLRAQASAFGSAVPRSGATPSAKWSEPLSSPSAAARFQEIAYELAHSASAAEPQIDQAIIFLTAAKSLDYGAAGIEPLLLKLATRQTDKDYSDHIILWLQHYVNESANRVIVGDAIRYLMDRRDSREQRKEVLERLVTKVGNRSAAIDSELAALLGLLMLEKGDAEAAKFYLIQAYTKNKHNTAAFAKLGEVAPREIGPATYLEHVRLIVRENPLNIDAAAAFAQYAERLQLYDIAAPSYQYTAELFRYLYPSELLPAHIYLPWAICCYNMEGGEQICVQIADNVRKQGRFDILVEAIAGRAAMKAGRSDEARQILQQAEQRALQLLQAGSGTPQPPAETQNPVSVQAMGQLNAKQIAWFYCFADPNPARALDWANRAYSVEPNSLSAGALLAYALSINNQLEWAKPLLNSLERVQIADLVQARIQQSEGRKAEAAQTLKIAVARDAGSLAAEKAREMLKELGSDYVPSVDVAALRKFLTEGLGSAVVPQFMSPEKMVDIQFGIRSNEITYGSEIEGVIAIVNRACEPLIVTGDSLFQGNIRIDARVTGGIHKEIPNLVSLTLRTDLAVAPGRSVVHVVKLSTGELRRLLMTYPQASLEIQLTLYLDPVTTADGSISNRLVDLEPVTVTVSRPGVEISASYVRARFNSISSGQQGQKTQTAQLFTGLLREQYAIAEHGTLYAFKYAEWLPELLRSAFLSPSGLLLGPGENEWVVKVHTMADMLSMPIDQELATVVAKNLNYPKWPVRLMAVYLLAGKPGNSFNSVLNWVAETDASELVRSMAISLRSASSDAAAAGSASVRKP